jgi:hypothetical protein
VPIIQPELFKQSAVYAKFFIEFFKQLAVYAEFFFELVQQQL